MRVLVLAVALGMGLACAAAAAPPAPPPLEAYGQQPTIEQVKLSPSGQRLALIARDAKGAKVYVRQIGGPMLMAAPIGDGFNDRIIWASDDIVLVRVATWLGWFDNAVDLASHKVVPVLKADAMVNFGIVGFYGVRELGSRWYGFYAGTTCRGLSPCQALFRVDLETGKATLLNRSDNVTQWVVDEAGVVTARLTYDQRNSHWRLTSMPPGRMLAEGAAGFDGVELWGSGRTPNTVALHTRDDDGYYTVFEAPLTGDAPARAITRGQEVTHEWIDPDTGRVVGYCWWDGACHYVFFDPLTQKRADAATAAFAGYRVTLESASRDFSRIVAFTDGGDDSGTYWLVDIATGKASILGSAYPLVPPAATGPTSVFRYKAADGLPLEAVLTLPSGRDAKGLPLVVLAHSGPEGRANLGFDWLSQAFASRGYAVLYPNFRGSTGYGKAFREAGFGQWGLKMQTDLSDGVDALAAAGVVDPKRVCIFGAGYGGYAAVAGVTLQQGRYRCAVGFGGVYDLRALLALTTNGDDPLQTKHWAMLLGAAKADARLDAVSPVALAAHADAPILLVDIKPVSTVVQQAPQMAKALKAAGKPVEMVTIDSHDWEFRMAATRTAMLNAAVTFVEKYDPSDAR